MEGIPLDDYYYNKDPNIQFFWLRKWYRRMAWDIYWDTSDLMARTKRRLCGSKKHKDFLP